MPEASGPKAGGSPTGGQPSPAPMKPSFAEFVAILALMMGMTAFSIDNLLPAFPEIGSAFAVSDANDVQLLVYAYLIGIGVAQLFYGTISDVVGRRPALIAGLLVYALGCIMALFADSFAVLIAARVVQGTGAAAGRVLAIAIVRDRFEGREMARIMSLVLMVFLIVPILAPALGTLILLAGTWHLIFVAMLAVAGVLTVWFLARMPETLHPEYRRPFSLVSIAGGIRVTVTTRRAMGYTLAVGFMTGALMTYVGSAAQVFQTDVYKLGAWFPIAFSSVAALMAVASFLNATLVRRLGMRFLSHSALIGFVTASAAMVLASWAYDGRPPLVLFCIMVGLVQFLFALCASNFNSIAMEPLGAVAGTAASFIGAFTTLMAALLALAAGRHFDGTVLPLSLGYFTLGTLALVSVLWAERWRLLGGTPSFH